MVCNVYILYTTQSAGAYYQSLGISLHSGGEWRAREVEVAVGSERQTSIISLWNITMTIDGNYNHLRVPVCRA